MWNNHKIIYDLNLIKENFEYIKERLISNKNTGISDYINDVIQTV